MRAGRVPGKRANAPPRTQTGATRCAKRRFSKMRTYYYSGQARPVNVVSGRNIAHVRRTAAQRALLAADILDGKVRLEDLTQLQLAAILHVSVPSIQTARRINGNAALRDKIASGIALNAVMPTGNGLVKAWHDASALERAGLARIVGVDEIWDTAIEPVID
jgi:hypothetical protein